MRLTLILLLIFSMLIFACQPKAKPELPTARDNKKTAPVFTIETKVPSQRITSLSIPETLSFAREVVPIERPDVREALEHELTVNTFRHSSTLSLIKKIERWRPLVSEILEKSHIPQDFIYLAVIESEFDNNAKSPAGAVGMWQIMEETAKDYKLKINKDVDMRRDPKLATEAASAFLNWSHNNLKNWTLTAASYNIGMKGIKDRLEEQKVNNYYDLHLNSETGRYVYRILALKLILENPEAYGYFIPDEEKYTPFRFTTVTVDEDIDNLVDFAKKNNTTYKELRMLNPWFNNTSNFKLNIGKKDSYEIRVPVK